MNSRRGDSSVVKRDPGSSEERIIRENNDFREQRKGVTRARSYSRLRNQREPRSRSLYTKYRHRSRRYSSDSRSPNYRQREPSERQHHRTRRRSISASPPPARRRRDSREHHKRSSRYHSTSSSPPPKRSPRDSVTASDRAPRRREGSYSPPPKRRRRDSRDSRKLPSHHHRPSPPPRRPASPPLRSKAPLPSQQAAYNKDPTSTTAVAEPIEKQKPNYAPTGKLAADTNTVAGTSIILKYNEPPESRLPPPSSPWRLYVFKGPDLLETLPLHTRSCWLFGRERAVVDVVTEHPSCSKQHAVLQFRYVERKNEFGDKVGGVRPYVIDLESANGTKLNGERVEGKRYVEVMSGDVVGFGESTREYVVMLPPKE